MKKWNQYTTNEIKPQGWLKNQLKLQASSLSGNLDKIWKDVKDSAWIGGKEEGWERVPYWLDGFIPLAYLLEDKDMITRVKKYIDAIISFKQEDGWICPCKKEERTTYDTWAIQLITKVLVVYYECSKDERIPQIIYDILKNYYELLESKTIKLFGWGQYRWFECFIAINFIYEKYPEEWLISLANILYEQGIDYTKLTKLWERPLNVWTLDTHIVNITMALKQEAVSKDILNKKYYDKASKLIKVLDKYNGTPVGLFTGDECLSGLSPIQGTELCSVVEQMYSYELLYSYTGNKKWLDLLEVLAFNALPATISDDMWAHQYVQMSNQIACQKFGGKPIFRTNGDEAHLFGLEPNFGCCTANFNQGWPKLALATYMYNDNTIINTLPIPSKLETKDVIISLETEYPFKNNFKYIINSNKDFTFKIRIPKLAKNIRVNNKIVNKKELTFDITKNTNQTIYVSYEFEPLFIDRPHDLKTVKYGSLVFSVPIFYSKKKIEYIKDNVERKYPYCDYEYIPKTNFNYAYSSDDLEVINKEVTNIAFSSKKPPITIKTKVKQINWGYEDGYTTVARKTPLDTTPISDDVEIELYPYGCSKLRMTEIPKIEE